MNPKHLYRLNQEVHDSLNLIHQMVDVDFYYINYNDKRNPKTKNNEKKTKDQIELVCLLYLEKDDQDVHAMLPEM